MSDQAEKHGTMRPGGDGSAATPPPSSGRDRTHAAFWFPETDGPPEAESRRVLSRYVRLSDFELADIRQRGAVLRDVGAIATVCAGRIQMLQPRGAVRLAGYGFGGVVAFETAVQLAAAGREVALVALIEPIAGEETLRDEPPAAGGARRLSRALLASGATRVMRRLAVETESRGDARFVERVRRRFRREAIRGYRPRRYAGSTLLVCSDEHAAHPAMARWQEACSDLSLVRLPGSQAAVPADADRPALASAFVAALERSKFAAAG